MSRDDCKTKALEVISECIEIFQNVSFYAVTSDALLGICLYIIYITKPDLTWTSIDDVLL